MEPLLHNLNNVIVNNSGWKFSIFNFPSKPVKRNFSHDEKVSVVPENIHTLPINVIFQGGGGSLMQDCLKGNVQVKFPIFPEIIGWWLANDCLIFVYNNDAKKHCPKSLYLVFLEFLNWAIGIPLGVRLGNFSQKKNCPGQKYGYSLEPRHNNSFCCCQVACVQTKLNSC